MLKRHRFRYYKSTVPDVKKLALMVVLVPRRFCLVWSYPLVIVHSRSRSPWSKATYFSALVDHPSENVSPYFDIVAELPPGTQLLARIQELGLHLIMLSRELLMTQLRPPNEPVMTKMVPVSTKQPRHHAVNQQKEPQWILFLRLPQSRSSRSPLVKHGTVFLSFPRLKRRSPWDDNRR